MAKVLSSISGNLISAASAGYAPTNSADVSAIASAYQVVSATGTQLYAGTAHVTSVNGAPISASRAGNAANASMATSAYYDGTGRLISALPDSAAVSAIASGYGTSKVDKSAISAQSAQWNSVYTTVNLNSANWSGSTGGSVTSPNGTIVVMDGNEIEGTNSAVLTASGLEYLKSLSPYGNSIGTQPAPLTYSYVDYTGCTLSIALVQDTYQDTTAILSGHNPQGQLATASANILAGLRTIELPMGGIVSAISASANSWLNFNPYDSFTARKSGDIMVTGIGELAWQSAVDNVTNTVADNSASWGQGGVDSATVSSIASSYAQSAVSGVESTVSANSASWGGGATGDYVETSATEVSIGSGNTAQSTAFAQGVKNYSTGYSLAVGTANTAKGNAFAQGDSNSAQGHSLAQGYRNTARSYSVALGTQSYADYISFAHGDHVSASNTVAAFGQNNLKGNGSTATGNSAAFVIGDGTSYNNRHDLMLVTKDGEITMYSSTADTTGTGIMSSIRAVSASVSSKADSSALSSYALSADVSSTIDTVSSNSASWAGGAVSLPITGSAGTDSATYGKTSVEFTRYDTAGEPDIRTASLSPDALDITYTVDENDYYSVHVNENGIEFSDPDGYYSLTPYDITNWNSAVDTVANNSASWSQSGPVTATASAAVTAYTSTGTLAITFTGISGVNGSALLARNLLPNAQQANGNAHFHYMPATSPWGSTEYTGLLSPLQYATGAALAMKQTNEYGAYYKGNEWFISDVGTNVLANGVVRAELHRNRGIHLYGSSLDSSRGFHLHGSGIDGKYDGSAWLYGPTEYNMLTSVNDTVSNNSATWGQGGGIDSADCSAIASSYANDVSAAVSGTVDTVSSQSANWGGSALGLSAGPGISITIQNGFIVISTAS